MATSLSFVVNAYNFLFIKRYAIYIWFAIAPLLWTVTIMIGSAFVTSSYKKLKLVVMQSWVEIPEKYDELWGRRATSNRVNSAATTHRKPNLDWRAGLENMRRRKAAREAAAEAATLEGQEITGNDPNSHVVDIHDGLSGTETKRGGESVDLFVSTIRNINLINKFLKKPSTETTTAPVDVGDIQKTEDEYKDDARLSMYDNVPRDTENDEKVLNDLLNSGTGEESSYISGMEFRETTSSSAETANEQGGNTLGRIEGSSDTMASDANPDDVEENKEEENETVVTVKKTLRTKKASKGAKNSSVPSIRLLGDDRLKDDSSSAAETTTTTSSSKVEKNRKSNRIRLRRVSKKLLNNKINNNNKKDSTTVNKEDDKCTESVNNAQDEQAETTPLNESASNVKFGQVVRIAQQVSKFTDNTKKVHNRRKFNYEKYIKYLELTLDTVGFSLGKVTITWDRVSFFIVLLMTLVGVFAQNAFLK